MMLLSLQMISLTALMILPIPLLLFIVYIVQKKQYEKTEYYQQTQNAYIKVRSDTGLLGEFYIYKYLKPLEGYQRYLFNVYVPKANGETTELDVVLLHESGIYVFESKNYSGWIFGTESQKYWTQTLPSGRGRSQKRQFFNPILQNPGHLNCLKEFFSVFPLLFYSYIVFSDRCTLKDISLTSGKHNVMNRYQLLSAVQQNAAAAGLQLSSDKIDMLYEKLYPLTQVGEAGKKLHISNIEQKQRGRVSQIAHKTTEMPRARRTACPHCGGKLVMRMARRGSSRGRKFLGCSNYPRCRYIQNLPNKY